MEADLARGVAQAEAALEAGVVEEINFERFH
jgi:hypothetical protein